MSFTPTPPRLELDGPRATITLQRPAQHNRLEQEDLVVLNHHLDRLAADPGLRVLILTATGPSFSAGYDINALIGHAQPAIRYDVVLDRLEAFPRPVICALNGSAYGAAADLALACDFRIGVTGMKLMVPAVKIGMHYHPGGLQRFISRLGLAATRRIFLLAESLDANSLLTLGFLDRLVAPEALMAEAAEMADILAGMAPSAMSGMKETLNGLARGNYDSAAAEARHFASFGSTELAIGLRALAQKEKPVFPSE